MRLTELAPVFVETISPELEEGKLYISKEYGVAVHLCACGCKQKTVTSLGPANWFLTENGGLVTLRPSIGNFSGENPHHAHYYITNNKIEWL